ncbi:MAG TPA: ATPase, T2SS/T4P/T4SS family [Candidatus Gastranaerophilales bacterium]|nr:ATPase, T2SS/T4P/T4SS family [Candidatus Gastranaerophilales bacterium]
MSSDKITEKIKNNINLQYVKKFSLENLYEKKFIPINKAENYLVVGILNADTNEHKTAILTQIVLNTKLKPKILPLAKEQFESLYIYCKELVEISEQPESISVSDNMVSIGTVKLPEKAPKENAPKKRLGDQLLDDGIITRDQLDEALFHSKQSGTPIGSVLVKLNFITVEQLRMALSKQQGFESVGEKDLNIDPAVIKLLPEDFIRENKVAPIRTDGKVLVVGMVNPNDTQVLNDIIYLTGLKPNPMILTHIEFEQCIKNFFETVKETQKILEEIKTEGENVLEQENDVWDQFEKEVEEDSNLVAKFASSIITDGIDREASDIHIEPRAEGYIVRYRTQGIMKKVFDIPKRAENSVISRLKVIARMDISEHRRPQDGHISLKYNDRVYDLRVSTLPVNQKEKMVIRILAPDLKVKKGDKRIRLLGATQADIERIELMTARPHGIILAAGPTGSGKTTTLYSILNKINNEEINITTVEDPVEIKLEGINQVQVNTKADITFASSLRSILRQDPDVIMIGEIRDIETLEAAVHASITGHLVLSTIHTNSAATTVTRLTEMGATPYLIASALEGVISQRLIRKLCPKCKQIYEPGDKELRFVSVSNDDREEFLNNSLYKPSEEGCDACNHTGYSSRLGIYEVLTVNREIKRLIANNSTDNEIEELAISCGMKTLQNGGLNAVLAGETSIAEFVRVFGVVNG